MKIVECPRDAMQGITRFIGTDQKVAYLSALLRVGFHWLDCGSFVAPQAIPQMRDTPEVFARLEPSSFTKILSVVANVRGVRDACSFPIVDYIGYPLSISETFQRLNTRRSIDQAWADLVEMRDLCQQAGKELVVYISMGFGNPYGEPYHPDQTLACADRLIGMSIHSISVADTVGVATLPAIRHIFQELTRVHPTIDFGAHLHSDPTSAMEKIEAVHQAGCQRIEGTLGGWGGCPLANNPLVGNIPTEAIIAHLNQTKNASAQQSIKSEPLAEATRLARAIFLEDAVSSH